MSATKSSPSPPATDSSTDLHKLVGDDATAEFESDPKFRKSRPGSSASSENVAVQRDTDDSEESDEEIEDEEEDADEDYDEEEDEDLDEEEDEDLDEEEDEDIEDDEDEVGAAAA